MKTVIVFLGLVLVGYCAVIRRVERQVLREIQKGTRKETLTRYKQKPDVAGSAPTVDTSILRPNLRPDTSTAGTFLPKRTADEIKRKFPWIKKPQTTDAQKSATNSAGINGSWPVVGEISDLPPVLGLSPSTTFENELENAYEVEVNPGFYRVPLYMKWKNIPVYAARLAVEQDSSGIFYIDSLDGELLSGIDEDISSTTPSVSSDEALRLAVQYNRDSLTSVTNRNVQLMISLQDDKARLTYRVDYLVGAPRNSPNDILSRLLNNPTGRLLAGGTALIPGLSIEYNAIKRLLPEDVRDRLSKLRTNDIRRPVTLLDANTGQVFSSWDGMASLMEQLSMRMGNPIAGIQTHSVLTTKNGNTCKYEYPIQFNAKLYVTDPFSRSPMEGLSFQCSIASTDSYDATNDARSPRNAAYKWGIDTVSYVQRVTSERIKKDVVIEVHNVGVTSLWTGERIKLGDGSMLVYPLTEPDIVAHEIGHVVTEQYSKLENYGQPGAISEAYSDMLSVAFMERNVRDPNFQIGALVTKAGIPLRDLCNPKSPKVYSTSDTSPNLDHASQWSPGAQIHRASGIYSKAFCLLSKTANWNVDLAFKVFTRANMLYWNRVTQFTNGACGVRKAAEDLISNTISARQAVDAAFAAVGVQCSELQIT